MGFLLNPHRSSPPRYPIDESVPPDVADPYSLSKQVDELTLAAACRRFGASGVAFRLPLMISPANVDKLRAWKRDRSEEGAAEGWSWLDVRDGAEAFRLALVGDYTGAHVLVVAAPTVFHDQPTDPLLDRYAPGVPRREPYPGRTAPIDTGRATRLLGFTPKYGEP
jgi:nucleoside-diphosphate-sugar epimerase